LGAGAASGAAPAIVSAVGRSGAAAAIVSAVGRSGAAAAIVSAVCSPESRLTVLASLRATVGFST
jgi:hypothetical protein